MPFLGSKEAIFMVSPVSYLVSLSIFSFSEFPVSLPRSSIFNFSLFSLSYILILYIMLSRFVLDNCFSLWLLNLNFFSFSSKPIENPNSFSILSSIYILNTLSSSLDLLSSFCLSSFSSVFSSFCSVDSSSDLVSSELSIGTISEVILDNAFTGIVSIKIATKQI